MATEFKRISALTGADESVGTLLDSPGKPFPYSWNGDPRYF